MTPEEKKAREIWLELSDAASNPLFTNEGRLQHIKRAVKIIAQGLREWGEECLDKSDGTGAYMAGYRKGKDEGERKAFARIEALANEWNFEVTAGDVDGKIIYYILPDDVALRAADFSGLTLKEALEKAEEEG